MDDIIKEQKLSLRKEILNKRSRLTTVEIKEYSEIICNKLVCCEEYKRATDVCLFMPIHNEVDVAIIFRENTSLDKRFWFPRVVDKSMDFYKADKDTNMIIGPYGIREPETDIKLIPSDKTLIVMPGSVFSSEGARIGYGAGYYDKFLAKYPECMTIAVAYDFQVLDDVPVEEFDIRPNMIITNTEDYYVK